MPTRLEEKLNQLTKHKKITRATAYGLLRELKDPWQEVRGILTTKKIVGVKYQRKIRKEWQSR